MSKPRLSHQFLLSFAALLSAWGAGPAHADGCDDPSMTDEARNDCLRRRLLGARPIQIRGDYLTVKNNSAGTQSNGVMVGGRYMFRTDEVPAWWHVDAEIGRLRNGQTLSRLAGEVTIEPGGPFIVQAGAATEHTPLSSHNIAFHGRALISTPVGFVGGGIQWTPSYRDRIEDASGGRFGIEAVANAKVWRLVIDGSAAVSSLSGLNRPTRETSTTFTPTVPGEGVISHDVILGYQQSDEFGGKNTRYSIGATGQISDRFAVRARWISDRNRFTAVEDWTGRNVARGGRTSELRVGGVISLGR